MEGSLKKEKSSVIFMLPLKQQHLHEIKNVVLYRNTNVGNCAFTHMHAHTYTHLYFSLAS